MKRFLVVSCVVGFFAALSLSHLVLAGKPAPEMIWCHARDAAVAPDSWQVDLKDGRSAEASGNADPAHLAQADSVQASSVDSVGHGL